MATIKIMQSSIDELRSAIAFSAEQTTQAAYMVDKVINNISGMSFAAKPRLESELASLKNRLNQQARLRREFHQTIQAAVDGLAAVDDSAGTSCEGVVNRIMTGALVAKATGVLLATKDKMDKQAGLNSTFLDGISSLLRTRILDIVNTIKGSGSANIEGGATTVEGSSSIINVGTSISPQYDMSQYRLSQSYKGDESDEGWAGKEYAPGYTYAYSGCLVTAIAEVESYYQKECITPPEIVSRLNLQFTGGCLTHASANAAGYTVEEINNTTALERIYEQLKYGPVIIGGERAEGGSHYMVVSGYVGDGQKPLHAADFVLLDNSDYWKIETLESFMTEDRVHSGGNDKWPYLTEIYYKSR